MPTLAVFQLWHYIKT